MTTTDLRRLVDVKRRQAERNSDPVQLRTDVDWLVGQLEETLALLRDLRRALGDIEILASDAQGSAFAAAQLSRMVRTNDPVPASPREVEGGEP